MDEKKKPIKVFKCGGVRAAVWTNSVLRNDENVTEYSIQVDRTFKNKEGEFEHTSKFYPRDLPKLRLVSAKADEFCNLKVQESDEADGQ